MELFHVTRTSHRINKLVYDAQSKEKQKELVTKKEDNH